MISLTIRALTRYPIPSHPLGQAERRWGLKNGQGFEDVGHHEWLGQILEMSYDEFGSSYSSFLALQWGSFCKQRSSHSVVKPRERITWRCWIQVPGESGVWHPGSPCWTMLDVINHKNGDGKSQPLGTLSLSHRATTWRIIRQIPWLVSQNPWENQQAS